MPHNVLEGNKYKNILTDVDIASRYKTAGPLGPRNQARLYLYWKKGGVFKYPKLFQCGNGPEFKSEVTKFLEKQNVDIRRTTTKYKYTHNNNNNNNNNNFIR